MTPRFRRLLPIYVVAAVVVLSLSIYVRLPTVSRNEITAQSGLEIGDFNLKTLDGRDFSKANIAGRPLAVFFGFTHCPEICPTTLAELTSLLKEMGEAANELTPIFITVDPERDSAESLRQYMTAFDARIIALRGDVDATRLAAKAFAASFKKVPTEGGDYTMDHSAGVRLVKADGTLQGTLDMHDSRDAQVKKLIMLAHTAPTHVSSNENPPAARAN
ncbi:SCO family protein [Rhizobium sp. FKL33]|uniref:SCO family protein n=1 Tax=Rhizobium sp. FKL33 TaxID=2562307 RepID=UPI0010C1053A|nr:SCO family protein [Rhizobium sp. FKL33]